MQKDQFTRPVPDNYDLQDRNNQLSYSCIDDEKFATNPLQQVVDDFVSQRVSFLTNKNEGFVGTKPSLKIFIERFESEMMKSDLAYQQTVVQQLQNAQNLHKVKELEMNQINTFGERDFHQVV